MAETVLKIVRVFIGSPGGLEAERQTARRIVDEINQNHSEHWGCQIQLVGWEVTLPGYSRAQSLINQDLDKCDYFTGILWNHWGSRPDYGDSKFTSGFHEEFERAKQRVEKGVMKDIALFFKDIPEIQLKDLGPSVKQVIAFREKCIKERKPLFKQFKDIDDFDRFFTAKITDIGWREFDALRAREKEISDPEQPAKIAKTVPPTSDSADRLVGASPANFVGQLIDRPSDWNATNAFEVARFRLIALGLSRTGNDEMYLGNHDANLLFIKRNDFDFDEQENRTLIDAGVAGFHHQNVPLWNWVSAPVNSGDIFWHIKFRTAFGSDQEKVNALRLLQCTGQKTPNIGEMLDRKKFLGAWLLEDPSDKVFAAALEFLSTNGDSDDLNIIEGFVDRVPENRKSSLAVTIIRLLAAVDLPKAFEKLIEFDPDTVGDSDSSVLFAYPESVPTAIAQRCLKLKSETVRKAAAALLNSRQAIDKATAEKLLSDTDPEVRFVAIESLIRQGEPPQEDTIKQALIRQQRPGLLGFGFTRSVPADNSYYDKFRKNRLSKLSYNEIRRQADASGIFSQLELSVLFEKYTKKCLKEIRDNINDGYKSYFDSKFDRLASLYRGDEKFVSEVKELEDHLRRGLVSNTLNALCANLSAEDLVLVRKTLDKWDVEFSDIILKFLEKLGDWSDVNRILALDKRSPTRLSLVSMVSNDNTKSVASALYGVGKSRIIDLIGLKVSANLRRAIIREFNQKDILNLSDDTLISQLNNIDDEVRKILALKCARSLSQARSRDLLEKYVTRAGERYYNSIHWLDLGAKMSRDVVKTVTKFELRKTA